MAFAEFNGARFYYETREHVFPSDVLFLHGNLASSRWWHPALEHWPTRAENSGRYIAMDWRGCGQSQAPDQQSDMNIDRLADDVLAFMDHLQLSRTHVVSHSTGGLIALLAMAKRPQLFDKAVLLDPVGPKGVVFDQTVEDAFVAMAKDDDLAGAIVGATIHNADPSTAFFQDVVKKDAATGAKNIGLWLLKSLAGLDKTAEVAGLPHEVLVAHGELDAVLKPEDSKALAQSLANGHFRTLTNHGHCMNVEDPNQFAEMVYAFLFSR